jgi:predicted PurR-regulated permease PerM
MPDTSFPSLDAAAARPDAEVGSAPVADSSRAMTLFVMTVATLYFGKEVLVPITLALLLAFVLAPLVGLLRHLRIGRVPSVLLAVLLAVGLVLALGGVIGSQLAELTGNLPQYAATIEDKVATVRRVTIGRLSALTEKIGNRAGTPAANAPEAAQAQSSPQAAPAPNALPSASSPLELAQRYLSPVLSPLATFGIVFVVAIFALLQQEDLRDRLIRLFGTTDLHRATVAIDDGGRRLSRYFLTQLCINTGFGCLIGVGLFFIGVPNPVLWAILSALLRFVPYVGAFISALLPVALAAAVAPGWSMPLWTFGLFVVTELVTGQAIEPLVYGHSTGLSPFSVIVAAIFWSWVWGPIGLILSTPLTLCLVVLGRHVDRLEFLDVLLGDTPALTPMESFYQRLLAGDQDEVLEEAERTLKQRSLSTYYDEVALKGLQLATQDSQRGVLTHGQLEHVKRTIKALVGDLAAHDDVAPKEKPAQPDDTALAPAPGRRELPDNPTPDGSAPAKADLPPPWQGEAPILCMAGRGPLDEAASAMLVQLLGKHGLGARLTPCEAASRDRVEMLDVSGVAMACISYLDISGSPAHLRYLMQRLRRKLPKGTPILVGLWPPGEAALTDRTIQMEIGADYFTSSLRDTVDTCLKVARGGAQG